jgi:predicted protein tyrosine phosphatase
MPHPQLVIFGYSEAAMFLRGSSKPHISGIISIHGSREFGVEAEVPQRLDLMFDDVEVAVVGDVEAMQRVMSRRRWAEQNGLTEVAPVRGDAEAIVAFAEAMRNQEGVVLCHCGGGMSRAPAAALICLAVWRGVGFEDACVAEVMKLRRGAVPHSGLVSVADDVLQRGGKLVGALRRGGSGSTDAAHRESANEGLQQ